MRSLLFVPGDSARKMDKALASGADALVLDLEDAVALAEKATARRLIAGFLAGAAGEANRPRLIVRVNELASGLTDADLDAVMAVAPDAILLPKTRGGADLSHLAAKLAVREAEFALTDGSTAILALVEEGRGLFGLGSLAGSTRRLAGLAWGSEDLATDIGAERNREGGAYAEPFRLARSLTLFAAAAAGVAAIDSVYTDFRDLDGLAAECITARRDGFAGKLAIHPAQVAVINDAFTPSATAVATARAVVAAFAAAPGAGTIAVDGAMVDRAHLRRAERILSHARS